MQRRNRSARFAIAGGLLISGLSMIGGARAEDVASPSQPVPSTMESPAPAPDSAARQENSSEVATAETATETATANTSRVKQVSYTTQAQAAAPAATYRYVADPYGFTAWLNSTRAAYGLGPVGYDPNLASWANVNNSYQNASGLGHFIMGPARRQNSGMGDYSSVVQMWMASGAHRAALLDPSITWVGIAGAGAYWTFNAY